MKPVECEWEGFDQDFNRIQLNQEFDDGSQEMFKFVYNCASNNAGACNRMKSAIAKSARYLSTTFNFKSPVIVNATHYDFCSQELEKPCGLQNNIAKAGADMFYALEDKDGLERLYPQALVKQYQFPSNPKFSQFDITVELNAAADEVAWIDGDPPIQEKQADAFYIVTHELLHGLGFLSGWRALPDKNGEIIGLLPPITQRDDKTFENNQEVNVSSPSVREVIFDKYMIFLSDGSHVSEITKQLDESLLKTNDLGPSEIQLIRKMYELSSNTPKSFGFLPKDSKDIKDAVILETSIPYTFGSSISHVDHETYMKTPDFLMMFAAIPGMTIDEIVSHVNGNPGEYIGPKTRSVFTYLGYVFKN